MTAIRISPLQSQDIEALRPLQPPGWRDITLLFNTHFGKPYFVPVKAVAGNTIVGCGQLMLTRTIAWIGTVVAHSRFRRRGIGTSITRHLVQEAQARKVPDTYLLATSDGRPMYQRMGFADDGEYAFLVKSPLNGIQAHDPRLFSLTSEDLPALYRLDREASGEDRSVLMHHFLDEGVVYKAEDGHLQGFLLPALGEGLLIADNFAVAKSLLIVREKKCGGEIAVPLGNTQFISFLQDRGYQLLRRAYLMYGRQPKNWRPEMVFSRVGGYLC